MNEAAEKIRQSKVQVKPVKNNGKRKSSEIVESENKEDKEININTNDTDNTNKIDYQQNFYKDIIGGKDYL